MILIGLTGSIGMGKSATAQMFAEAGVPVYDADAAVHGLYAAGGEAVAPIETAFPGVTSAEAGVDRIKLRDRVLNNKDAVKRLEEIVHPLVRKVQIDFLTEQEAAGQDMVVLDIPLLFETRGHERMDVIVVVSAPADVQRDRVLARPGMTPEAFEIILAKQTPDSEKRRQAHFIVDTHHGFDHAREKVAYIIETLRQRLKDEKGSN